MSYGFHCRSRALSRVEGCEKTSYGLPWNALIQAQAYDSIDVRRGGGTFCHFSNVHSFGSWLLSTNRASKYWRPDVDRYDIFRMITTNVNYLLLMTYTIIYNNIQIATIIHAIMLLRVRRVLLITWNKINSGLPLSGIANETNKSINKFHLLTIWVSRNGPNKNLSALISLIAQIPKKI